MFERFAKLCSEMTGSAWFFVANIALTGAWLGLGPVFQWSDTWQLTYVTGLTVTTWWQTLLLQASSNRDTQEIKAQVSELGRAVPGAADVIGANQR